LRDTKTGERVMGKAINETSLDDFSADKTFQSIEEYMAGLTERQATVLRLRFIEQRTIPEISAMLGVSSTAIKNLVNRAIRALRENYR
jgi:RNA polymerase sigma factor (sigma-70 family)